MSHQLQTIHPFYFLLKMWGYVHIYGPYHVAMQVAHVRTGVHMQLHQAGRAQLVQCENSAAHAHRLLSEVLCTPATSLQ